MEHKKPNVKRSKKKRLPQAARNSRARKEALDSLAKMESNQMENTMNQL